MNKATSLELNQLWASLIVKELIRNGVDYFCLAPGSRSSPLALAVADNTKAKNFVHFDERGLGFHALGYVSATKQPAVIITTSGSAAANLFPAIIEASKKKLPLIILTADRPPELRFTGSNQTIDQVKLFGDYVRWFFDMPCPTQDIEPAVVLTTIDQAAYRSKGNPPGPVHLNCMFREPLVPVINSDRHQLSKKLVPVTIYYESLSSWTKSDQPYTRYTTSELTLSENSANELVSRINTIQNGLILVGKLGSDKDREAVLKLSEKLNWPVFADISSGLRLGAQHKNIIIYFDHLLASEPLVKKFKIDGVLHLGGRMTSRRLSDFLKSIRPWEYIMVLNHPLRNDPAHQVTLRLECSTQEAINKVISKIKPRKEKTHLSWLQKTNQEALTAFNKFWQKEERLSEPAVARLISEYIKEGSGLFIGNSLPIREMDMFASSRGPAVIMTANRGASGIDGNIASACGFAIGLNKPVTAFVGDLTLLHDLNSLVMLRDVRQPMVIVVLNNDGGGIFSFLSLAESNPKVFERFWGTPHDLTFELAAKMFHLHYAKPKTQNEFISTYSQAQTSRIPTLIEIETNREENFKIHHLIKTFIEKAVAP